MRGLLVFLLLLVPATAQGQTGLTLLTECSAPKGYSYHFPNAFTAPGDARWITDGMPNVTIGLFFEEAAEDPMLGFTVMYKTEDRGWHTPGPYETTVAVDIEETAIIALVLYRDNTAELYMFLMEEGKFAISLMRHSGIVTNARLFVGDCVLQ